MKSLASGRPLAALLISALELGHRAQHVGLGQRCRQRIARGRNDALAEHHRDPARDVEQLVIVAEHVAMLAEQLDLVLQGVRQRPSRAPASRTAPSPLFAR